MDKSFFIGLLIGVLIATFVAVVPMTVKKVIPL